MQPDRFRNDRTTHLDLDHSNFNPLEVVLARSAILSIADTLSITDYIHCRGSWIDSTRAYHEEILASALVSAGIDDQAIASYDWRRLAVESTLYARGEYFTTNSEAIGASRLDREVMTDHPFMQSFESGLERTDKLNNNEKHLARKRTVAFLGMTGLIDLRL